MTPWGDGPSCPSEPEGREEGESQERLVLMGYLAAGLYHEFGNLVSLLSTQFQLLEEQVPEGLPRQNSGARIRRLLVRSQTLATSIKAFSANRRMSVRACRAVPLIEELVDLHRGVLDVGKVQVLGRPCAQDGVQMDEALLQQVLLNLLSNAIDAVRTVIEPWIFWSVESLGEVVVIRVANNGPPIGPSLRETLFHPFVTTKTGPRRGTGLGLSFSRLLVQQFGGTLILEEGDQTCFQVRLPSTPDIMEGRQ